MFNIQTLPSMRTICLSRTGLDLYRSWPYINKVSLRIYTELIGSKRKSPILHFISNTKFGRGDEIL